VTRILGSNILQMDYTYFGWSTPNGQGRLQKITTGIPSDLDLLQDLRYTYDAVGNPSASLRTNVLTIKDFRAGPDETHPQTQILHFVQDRLFTYDMTDRLSSAIATGGSGGNGDYGPESYTYNLGTGNPSASSGQALSVKAGTTLVLWHTGLRLPGGGLEQAACGGDGRGQHLLL
jgi:hypothetical protein